MADLIYDWDDDKCAANIAKHGLDFADVALFDWNGAIVVPDVRRDYGEARFRAYARLGSTPCVLVFTRRGTLYRLISLRRANARERRKHGL